MPTRLLTLLLALLLAACARAPTEEEKLAKLDSLQRETHANLIRQQAECQAVAYEFQGDRQMVESCLDTYRFMVENARRTYADIDKRRAQITGQAQIGADLFERFGIAPPPSAFDHPKRK